MTRQRLQAVLFDLDGTLIDSAPDMAAAAAALCAELGQATPNAARITRVASRGARAILQQALPKSDAAAIEALVPRFLEIYAQRMTELSAPYDGIPELLELLRRRGIPWGIVTNKRGFLARPMVAQLGLDKACAALVSGDCLPVAKPAPEPVLLACEMMGVAPGSVVFIGDDLRDIQAGRAAGTATIAAAWGYLDGGDPYQWQADQVVAEATGLQAALAL